MLRAAIVNWSYKLGIQPLGAVEMGRLARLYKPDLEIDGGTQQLPCMCNRYRPGERETIRSIFDARLFREINDGPAIVHPKEPGWVVRLNEGERVLEQMTWGFPVYLRDQAGQPLKVKPVNNARFDKLGGYWKRWATEPANRCLIPTAEYAEAVGPAGRMTTTWLSVKGAPLFAWAGLWRGSDEWGACYTGVMTENAAELAAIHDRAPVILHADDWHAWLTAPLDELSRFDRPWPAAETIVNRTDILWKSGGRAPPNPQAGLPLGPAPETSPPRRPPRH
jgi:putative SOS response-associated peptidase YedK